MKNLFLASVLFALASIIAFSCRKKTQTQKACELTDVKLTCKAGRVTISPDSLYVLADTINNRIIMGIQDTTAGFRAYVTIRYTLQDFDIPMGKDSFGFANATTSYGGISNSQFGNVAMRFNADKTVCGNFFWQNATAKLYVSQGMFANLPLKYF